jgi:hypothetical protein
MAMRQVKTFANLRQQPPQSVIAFTEELPLIVRTTLRKRHNEPRETGIGVEHWNSVWML